MWSIVEAVAWIVSRRPDFVNAIPANSDIDAITLVAKHAPIQRRRRRSPKAELAVRPPFRRTKLTYSTVPKGVESLKASLHTGAVFTTAMNLKTGGRLPVPKADWPNLELYYFDDLPGKPFVLRSRSDHLIRWSEPMLLGAAVQKLWPGA